jgi:hypothetical protein
VYVYISLENVADSLLRYVTYITYPFLKANFIAYLQSNLTECPEERSFSFTIFPEGLEERVNVDVEHVCDCDCQLEPEAVIEIFSCISF